MQKLGRPGYFLVCISEICRLNCFVKSSICTEAWYFFSSSQFHFHVLILTQIKDAVALCELFNWLEKEVCIIVVIIIIFKLETLLLSKILH